jgi:hypothetical protein
MRTVVDAKIVARGHHPELTAPTAVAMGRP